MRRRLPPVIIILTCLIAACRSASTPVAVPGAGDATIPRGAVRAIAANWPRAELGSSRSATCPAATGAPPALLQGDLDGDGLDDAVLWITVDGAPRAVAVLARLNDDYAAVDLGDAAAAATGAFELASRGTPYQTAALALELHFGVDTPVLRDCDGKRTAFFWTGTGFRPELLAAP